MYVDLAREEARELARTGGETRAGVGAVAADRAWFSVRLAPAGLAPQPYPEINFATEWIVMDCHSGLCLWRRPDYRVRDWWFRSSVIASDTLRRWRQPSRG